MLVGNFYAENKNFFLSVTSPVTLFSLKEPLELKLFHCAVSIAPLNFHRLKAVFCDLCSRRSKTGFVIFCRCKGKEPAGAKKSVNKNSACLIAEGVDDKWQREDG